MAKRTKVFKELNFSIEHVMIVYPYMVSFVQSDKLKLSPYASVNIESKYISYDVDGDEVNVSVFVSEFIVSLFGCRLETDNIQKCKALVTSMRPAPGLEGETDIVEQEAIKFLDHILWNLQECHLTTAIIIPPNIKMSVGDDNNILSGWSVGVDCDESDSYAYEDEDYEFN